MRVTTYPTPNVRVRELPVAEASEPLCLWGLERQAAGIEPGELARKPSIDFHPSVADPIIDVLLIVLVGCLVFDLYQSIVFLLEVAQ